MYSTSGFRGAICQQTILRLSNNKKVGGLGGLRKFQELTARAEHAMELLENLRDALEEALEMNRTKDR
jgi:hypothetical protein